MLEKEVNFRNGGNNTKQNFLLFYSNFNHGLYGATEHYRRC